MEYKDYYKILGVEKSASNSEIKKAYRKLVAKYHPDKSTGDENKFKDISEAYEILSNTKKRQQYDQFGNSGGFHGGQQFDPTDFGFAKHSESEVNFSDFFNSIFGNSAGGSSRQQAFRRKGSDSVIQVNIDLEDAVKGITRSLNLTSNNSTTKKINVKIPPGVKQGQRIRLPGQGGAGQGGGKHGYLYLEIMLDKHPLYTVKNEDVYIYLPLTPWEAALGAKIEVPTLKGKVNINIPAGAKSGNKLRIKNRGLGKNGNQYVIIQIETPPADTEEKHKFYSKMAEKMPFNPRSHF